MWSIFLNLIRRRRHSSKKHQDQEGKPSPSFIPISDSWVEIKTQGNRPTERYAHAMVCSLNSLWIFGGYNNNESKYYNDLYEFRFHDHSWRKVNAKGCIPPTLGCHSAVAYKNSLWIFGGFNGILNRICNSLYEFKIKEKKWKKWVCRNPPAERSYHIALVRNNKMLIYGGHCKTPDYHIHYFDFRGKWDKKLTSGAVPAVTAKTPGIIYEDEMYIFGGNAGWYENTSLDKFYALNLNTLIWRQVECTGEKPSRRYSHSVVIFGTSMYLFGGTESYSEIRSKNDFYEYNFIKKEWKKMETTLVKNRFWHSSFVRFNEMYIVCGTDSKAHYNDLLKYTFPHKPLNLITMLNAGTYCEIEFVLFS